MIDILSYLDSRGVDYATSGKNISQGWVGLQCINPFCGDKSNHFGINIATGNYSCWKCGKGGNAKKLVSLIDDCSLSKASEILSEFQRTGIYQYEPIRSDLVVLPKFVKKVLPKIHREYLEFRNFDPQLIESKYDVMGVEQLGDYKYRLIIPVYYQNKLVTFIARAVVDNAVLRYKNCPKQNSIMYVKECVYGIERATGDTVVVVEGVFDAWRMGDGFVSTFGTKITKSQLNILSRYKNVFFMFDATAVQEANEACEQICCLVDHAEVLKITVKDPDSFNESEVNHIRKQLFFT